MDHHLLLLEASSYYRSIRESLARQCADDALLHCRVRKQTAIQTTILNVWRHMWTNLCHISCTCLTLSEKFFMQLARNMMILVTYTLHQKVGLPFTRIRPLFIIGSRALSFSDPYFHFTCLSVRHSVILSFCRSVCPQLRS